MSSRSIESKSSFGTKLLEKLLIGIPFRLAQGLLRIIKSKERQTRIITVAVFILISVMMIVFFKPIVRILVAVFENGWWDPGWRIAVKFGVFYGLYLLVLQPCFLLIAAFTEMQKETFLREGRMVGEPNLLEMRKERLRSDKKKSYLGRSYYTGKSVYLTNDQRLTHMQVVGSTGTGKTESVLLPLLAHDIASGKGAVVIDGKGDLELRDRIYSIVKDTNRVHDFLFFSLAHPKDSNTYNPLLRGNATELKDKIVGSMAWSEEFYRRMAEQAAFTILSALKIKSKIIKFEDLHNCLTNYTALSNLSASLKDQGVKSDLDRMIARFKDNTKFLSGLIADLYLTSRGEFGSLVNVDVPDIDLLEAYENNKIVYFQLNLQGYGDTAKRMGRIILQDIKTVSSHIQAHLIERKRHFFPVFVDDASSFLELNFIDFLNKARAAQFGVTLLHQSLGDLVIRRDFSFQQQVIENTNIKVILRQDDPQSVEKFTKIAGTKKTLISTYQTEEKILGKGFTGTGSIREGQTFRVEPDLIRALKRGEAVVIWKNPSLFTDFVKLDFFGHPPYPGIFKPIRKEIKKEELPPESPMEEKKEPVKSGDILAAKGSQQVEPNIKTEEPRDFSTRLKAIGKANSNKKF